MKFNGNKAEFHGKHYKKNVSVIIEKGKDKNPKTNNYDVYNEDKEGTVTVFLEEVKSFDKKTGEKGYIANIPISVLNDIITAKVADEEGFGEMFNKCVANGKVWDIVRMIRQGSSENTVKGYAKDLKLPEEIVDKAYSIIESSKSQEA